MSWEHENEERNLMLQKVLKEIHINDVKKVLNLAENLKSEHNQEEPQFFQSANHS